MPKFNENDVVYYFIWNKDPKHFGEYAIEEGRVLYVNPVYHYITVSGIKNQLSWNEAKKCIYKTKKELLVESERRLFHEIDSLEHLLKGKKDEYAKIKEIYDKEIKNV